MSKSQIMQLKFFSRNHMAEIAFPSRRIMEWGLILGTTIQVQFGHRTVQALVLRHKGPDSIIGLSKPLADELLIPEEERLRVRYERGLIAIGPLVGIAVAHTPQSMKGILVDLIRSQNTENRRACCFLFNIDDVDWNQLTVEGYFLSQSNANPTEDQPLEKRTVPFPDVIYNKIYGRNRENSPNTLRFYQNLYTQTHCSMFNERYFHKWEIYQRLSGHPEIAYYLPETLTNLNAQKILDLLRKYRMIYLKPQEGFWGLGIYQLSLDKDGKIIARFRRNQQNVARRYASISSFLRQEFQNGKLPQYLAQQGIYLITHEGQPIDFRVHLNKNRENQWEITGIGAKIAGKGSVTTHVRNGGRVVSPYQILQTLFPDLAGTFHHRLQQASIAIAEALEKTSSHPLGELGLDMGIDKLGRIWMFEANSKPGKSIFKIDDLKGKRLYATGLILDYSAHLSNFA